MHFPLSVLRAAAAPQALVLWSHACQTEVLSGQKRHGLVFCTAAAVREGKRLSWGRAPRAPGPRAIRQPAGAPSPLLFPKQHRTRGLSGGSA